MDFLKVRFAHYGINNNRICYALVGEGFPVIVLLDKNKKLEEFPFDELLMPNWEYLETLQLIFIRLDGVRKNNRYDPVQMLWEIIKKLDFKKTALISHTSSTQTALNFSSRYSRRVEKLILINPAGIENRSGLRFVTPVLIISGKRFKTNEVEDVYFLNRYLQGSQLVIYPDLGKQIIYEPAVFNRIIRFLNNQV